MVKAKQRPHYDPDDRLSAQEVAEYLNLHYVTVTRLLKSRTIVGGKIGRDWQVLFSNIQDFERRILNGEISIQREISFGEKSSGKRKTR